MAILDAQPAPDAVLAGPTVRFAATPYDVEGAVALERELGISRVLAQVLTRRGITDAAGARAFLAPADRHSPARFNGIEVAVELVRTHIARGSRIVVHGDYDVDGVCATAVLVRALRAIGADAGFYLPSRSEDGYGLAAATVERLAGTGTGLLITVDCGITAVDEVNHARGSGMDVIITDHHQPRDDGTLPACPIVHPTVSGYPFTGLCGTAVAHKLAEALGADTVAADVELVALATVADLVPLVGENRRLVREGLALMAGTDRPGLRALMEVSRADPSGLDAAALGFRLAPRINAAGRLRRADAALELLLTTDSARARTVARELDEVNAKRRAVEQQMRWEAEKMAEAMGEDCPFYVLASDTWHQGVVGIVASRIVERFHRPAVLIALDPHDPMAPGHGSGRSIPGFDLLAALRAADGELAAYGGHTAAAGLTIEPHRIDAFRALACTHAAATLTPEMLTPAERFDAVASGSELTLELAEELAQTEPCGIGNPAPVLLVSGARFEDPRPMAEGRHARFSVVSGGARAAAVAFGCDGKPPVEPGVVLDATFRLERNTWKGVTEPRLVLRQAAAVDQPLQLLGEAPDYLESIWMELERDFEEEVERYATADRVVIDRRGAGPLSVIAEAIHAGAEPQASTGTDTVLVVCGDAQRRAAGLTGRTGGFALVSHETLVEEPYLADAFGHVVVLDPPLSGAQDAAVRGGVGVTYLAWGDAEVRFSQQMHEQEYGLRASLVALYRSLRERKRVVGEELEHLLRGEETQPRSARLAGRLVRVFTELELVSLDLDLPAMELAGAQPTQLELSEAYRAYTHVYEEGQRYLKAATARPSR